MTHAQTRAATEIEAKFWSKVDYDPHDTDRCWPWTDGAQRGYGIFRFRDATNQRHQVRPHRIAYILTFGEVQQVVDGTAQIDHRCHNPRTCHDGDACPHRRCCNPHHLTLANSVQNGAPDRMVYWQTLKTHCPQGHEYSPENTARRRNGHRYCKVCNRQRARDRQPVRTGG